MTKLCKCHNEPMKKNGPKWCCRIKQRERDRHYAASAKGRMRDSRYNATSKGEARKARYMNSEAYRRREIRASQRRWAQRIDEIEKELNHS